MNICLVNWITVMNIKLQLQFKTMRTQIENNGTTILTMLLDLGCIFSMQIYHTIDGEFFFSCVIGRSQWNNKSRFISHSIVRVNISEIWILQEVHKNNDITRDTLIARNKHFAYKTCYNKKPINIWICFFSLCNNSLFFSSWDSHTRCTQTWGNHEPWKCRSDWSE